MINYKFRENEILNEIKAYIDGTYDEHYATGKIQATESIIDDGHGTGFCMGNVGKYGRRYGKKGETPEEWRKDLMKVIHYSIIQMFIHDKEHGTREEEEIPDYRDLPNPIIDDGVDWSRAPSRDSLNDATPEEWDKASRMAFNPNGVSQKGRR